MKLFNSLLQYLMTGEVPLYLKMQPIDKYLMGLLDKCGKKIQKGPLQEDEAKLFLSTLKKND